MYRVYTFDMQTADGLFYLEHYYDESGALVKTILRDAGGKEVEVTIVTESGE